MFLLTALIVLGPVELFGHLPLIGIALLLVYQGTGSPRVASPDKGSGLELSTAGGT